MTDFLAILLGLVLVDRFVLAALAGPRAVPGTAMASTARIAHSLATILVLAVTGALLWMIERWVLLPGGLAGLRLPALVVAVIAIAPLVGMLIRRSSAPLSLAMGDFVPLLTIHAVGVSVALDVIREPAGLAAAVGWGIAGGACFSLLLLLMSEMLERLEAADVPEAFRGAAIALTTAGIMSLAFTGFSGLWRG